MPPAEAAGPSVARPTRRAAPRENHTHTHRTLTLKPHRSKKGGKKKDPSTRSSQKARYEIKARATHVFPGARELRRPPTLVTRTQGPRALESPSDALKGRVFEISHRRPVLNNDETRHDVVPRHRHARHRRVHEFSISPHSLVEDVQGYNCLTITSASLANMRRDKHRHPQVLRDGRQAAVRQMCFWKSREPHMPR